MLKSSKSSSRAIVSSSATAGFSIFIFKSSGVGDKGLAKTNEGFRGGKENHFLERAYGERVRDRTGRFNGG